MAARERDLEKECRGYVQSYGGALWKWTSPGRRGVQDRILLIPFAPVVFVEFKRMGGRYSAAQDLRHVWMLGSGFLSWRVESFEQFQEEIENLLIDNPKARKN